MSMNDKARQIFIQPIMQASNFLKMKVLLIHGLGRTPLSLLSLEWRLQ